MTCCAPALDAAVDGATPPSDEEVLIASRALGDGARQVELSVPAVHCAACMGTIEKSLTALPEVIEARVNLSTRRVTVRWAGDAMPALVDTLCRVGYPPVLASEDERRDPVLSGLLRAVAVCGFAAGNIMLLSVSVWSGAEGATRDLFHWISALIALPALAFGGGIYYRSAWSALSRGRMNMDVPIAVGISLAYAMSLYETLTHGQHAYFDASVSLLFFLLIGRTLDHVMRNRARTAVLGLSRMIPRGALVLMPDGSRAYQPLSAIEPGMRILIAAGERIPVDAAVVSGNSDIDLSLVTGESQPVPAATGMILRAGMLSLTGSLTIQAIKPAAESFLAEMMRMMEAAEGGRARYRRIADHVSSLYAPVVHLGALATFLGWMAVDGDWHKAVTIAIAVLIITCPCALGLAVPIVQVVAARRLFEAGIMVKDGSGLERLSEADAVVLDKTGTLTLGQPRLVNAAEIDPAMLRVAAALADHSRHPASRAVSAARSGRPSDLAFDAVMEHAGLGIEGTMGGHEWRLGRAGWASGAVGGGVAGETVLSRDGTVVATFCLRDQLRPDARRAVEELAASVGPVAMLSGDSALACNTVAAELGIRDVSAELLPAEKVARIQALATAGRRVLMVGDGLNDVPALAAAHVSVAPSTAADIGRSAADFVFLRPSLEAVPLAVDVARRAGGLIRQNIALAIVYNVVAVPVAVLGHVTPLVAAIAMSGSSILVVANALRLAAPDGRSGEASHAMARTAEVPS